MTTQVDIGADVIDSRDIIAEIEELRESGDDAERLAVLESAAAAGADYAADWEYGETLVRDSYFEEYAQEFAEDCGMIPEGLGWPVSCIDWKQAARELQMDYTSLELDGITYWVR